MGDALLSAASARRLAPETNEDDDGLNLLLANYQRVTADKQKMSYLRFLLKHYAASPTPWTTCFAADTPVDCPRDHDRYPAGIPISQVKIGQPTWSFNLEEGCFELKPVTWVGITRRNSALYRLTLDSGETIRATADHWFLRRDGSWSELKDLRPGDSLMPLYRDFTPRIKVRPDAVGAWKDEHQVVVDQFFGDERLGLAAHHVDARYCNTSTDNFELLTGAEHRRRHAETVQERFDMVGHVWTCADCGAQFQPHNGVQRYCDECRMKRHNFLSEPIECGDCKGQFLRTKSHQRYCPDCQDKRAELKIKGHRLICARCGSGFIANSATHKFCSVSCRDSSRDQKAKKAKRGSLGAWVECRQCSQSFIRNESNHRYCDACRAQRADSRKHIRICLNCSAEFAVTTSQKYCSPECRKNYKPVLVGEAGWNHKVVSVERLEDREDVWDIEVADNHTFVVYGVVVHNCVKDNFKRFGPKTKGLCAVIKDTIRQDTHWRHGAPRGPHPDHPDFGSPGVGIAYADAPGSKQWHGGGAHSGLKLEDVPAEIWALLEDLKGCDPCRVMLGLDAPPVPSPTFLELLEVPS